MLGTVSASPQMLGLAKRHEALKIYRSHSYGRYRAEPGEDFPDCSRPQGSRPQSDQHPAGPPMQSKVIRVQLMGSGTLLQVP